MTEALSDSELQRLAEEVKGESETIAAGGGAAEKMVSDPPAVRLLQAPSDQAPAPFTCPECLKGFDDGALFDLHVQLQHQSEGSVPAAPAPAPKPVRLNWPFPCPREGCDAGFETGTALQMHVRAKHKQEPSEMVSCPECPAILKRRGLGIHLAKKHGIHGSHPATVKKISRKTSNGSARSNARSDKASVPEEPTAPRDVSRGQARDGRAGAVTAEPETPIDVTPVGDDWQNPTPLKVLVTFDPEVEALGVCLNAMVQLDDAQQRRVIWWLQDRLGLTEEE